MSGHCFVDGCTNNAPYGFGLPGLRSDKPKNKRGYLWSCAEHRKQAEERRAQALGQDGQGGQRCVRGYQRRRGPL